ncbi:hypothetical protein BJV78DRAFT_1359786 [Lactifluus subvellereus]|nr:hypothetical protein BJV78DRAFT_1359786 [Lactifluus subvellereus]
MVSFNKHATYLLSQVIAVLGQTLVYGIYLSLISLLTYVMTGNGLETQTHRIVFAVMWFMFALSTMYWISHVVFTFGIIAAWFSTLDPFTHNPPGWMLMISDVLFINYIITDSVVVWRTWVLCADQSTAVLMIPVVTLIIDFLFYATAVGVDAAFFIVSGGHKGHRNFTYINNVGEAGNLGLSLLTNVLATSIIAYKAWKHRKSLSEVFGHKTSQASRILSLLIESGMLYIVIGVFNLVSVGIPLHLGSFRLSGLFLPMSIQLAGMYPIAVLLLVQRRTTNDTSFHTFSYVVNISREQRSHVEPMAFVPGPTPLSPSQTAIDKTGPQSTSVHLAFDSMVELGDMDASRDGK